jgi:antagonist of KipI
MPVLGVHALGESALLITVADTVTERGTALVHALRARLLELNLPGIVDVVPAYSSLLVSFDHEVLAPDNLQEQISHLDCESLEVGHDSSQSHTIPVVYGGDYGPDLPVVAALHGLSADDVIKAHTSQPFKVAFLGFLPGFPYMAGVSPSIATPRLSTPRSNVPAGSVGIAGTQTGIYPLNSPGGWRLIGRTDVQLWDPYRLEPALLAPGDSIRFVATQDAGEPPEVSPKVADPQSPAFEVVDPGLSTTIQDAGRPGIGHLGLARGGFSDSLAAGQANMLVGNTPEAAVLEMLWTGPVLRALRSVTIAWTGSGVECLVGSQVVPEGLSWFVRSGTLVSFKRARAASGMYAFMSVTGGFDVPVVLNSRSTCLRARFGGQEGRALRTGDVLGTLQPAVPALTVAGRHWTAPQTTATAVPVVLRLIRFSGTGATPEVTHRELIDKVWVVADQVDRMGARLRPADGTALRTTSGEVTSFGVVRGAVQVPPDGKPVILGVDHQTTGGYEVAGVVCEADWPKMAQLTPGCEVHFEEISLADARAAAIRTRTALRAGVRALSRF